MKNLRKGRIDKIIYKMRFALLRIVKLLNEAKYTEYYVELLKDYGMNIESASYIDPSASFDNYDYSMITMGNNVTVSREVLLLTHDFSITKGLVAIQGKGIGRFQKEIKIGNNCFIGARVIILPGTTIGDNVIIGSGAVVKGVIPPNSIVVGNPSRVVANMVEWTNKHLEKKDFIMYEG